MKKNVMALFLAGCVLLGGCASTPQESLVKQKGKASLKSYEEGEALEDVSGEKNPEEENKQEKENKLRIMVNAPEKYKNEVSDGTGKLKLITDAVVEIPDGDKVSSVAVSQHPFDQELIDKVTDIFFKDASIYTAESYYTWTKDDWRNQLEYLNGCVSEGNLDPYELGTDENGNLFYDIYANIEQCKKSYEEAPEEVKLVEIKPGFGTDDSNLDCREDYFGGVAVTKDCAYSYTLQQYDSMPMNIKIKKIHEGKNSSPYWSMYEGIRAGNPLVPDKKEMKEGIGITLKEARKMTDEKVKQLELPGMKLTQWEYGLLWADNDHGSYAPENEIAKGYILHYTRRINSIPITYTVDQGGAYEDMDSEMNAWGYEVMDFYVTKDGIDQVEINNIYDMGEVRTENLSLKSFDEIIKIYEKMMLIQNADVINYEPGRTYKIDRITLGYSRIYDPSSDSMTGILVPVWDFFGSFEIEVENKENDGDYINDMQYQSYLTINAVDGSIIERGLGY